jgi:hypothetical protein
MAGLFISYRRGDSAGYAGRLCDSLDDHFGTTRVFRDVDSIDPGLDFLEQIRSAVGSCDVLLAVIGPGWLTASRPDGQCRLHDPHDYVRLEIQEALSRKIRVIPVLVGGARMPSVEDLPTELGALARRNALELSDTRWDYDVGRLLSSLAKIPGLDAQRPANIDNRERGWRAANRGRTSSRFPDRVRGAMVGLSITAPLMLAQVALGWIVQDPLDRTVVKIGFFIFPLLGLIVGAVIGSLDTTLRGAVAGATIGGSTNLLAWPLGWWFWRDSSLPSVEPMELFKSVMLYLPGNVIGSGLIGMATVSIANVVSARMAKRRNA